jgi:hypothetical protein
VAADYRHRRARAKRIARAYRLAYGKDSGLGEEFAGWQDEGQLSYNYRMSKQAVSVTLRPDNLLWLKTHVKATGGRSLSAALDEIIMEARAGIGGSAAVARSVVGNARIPRSEEALSRAGAQVAALFRRSVDRSEVPIPRPRRTKPTRAVTQRKRG